MEAKIEVGHSVPDEAVRLASDRLWFQLPCELNDRHSILVHCRGEQIRIALTQRFKLDGREIDHGATIRTLTTLSEHRAVLVIGLLCAHDDPPAFIGSLVHPADMVDGDAVDLDGLEGERIVAAFRNDGKQADAA